MKCRSLNEKRLRLAVTTYRVTNFLPKLMDILLFSTKKKMNFHFLNSPIFGYCRSIQQGFFSQSKFAVCFWAEYNEVGAALWCYARLRRRRGTPSQPRWEGGSPEGGQLKSVPLKSCQLKSSVSDSGKTGPFLKTSKGQHLFAPVFPRTHRTRHLRNLKVLILNFHRGPETVIPTKIPQFFGEKQIPRCTFVGLVSG